MMCHPVQKAKMVKITVTLSLCIFQFGDSVLPLVAATPKHSDCLQKKKNELERIEHKLDAGLDR